MAKRPVYIPIYEGSHFVETKMIDFEWHPGFSVSQKQKSIDSLHKKYKETAGKISIIDISSKSTSELGVKLSAFNLSITTLKNKRKFSVENAFQASKVFEKGGPYVDILNKTPKEAKKDPRIRNSGRLVKFKFYDTEWDLEPKTAFYDWIYINSLVKNRDLSEDIINYDAFTDIEFNPEKSINCQAYSAALFTSLVKRKIFQKEILSKDRFLKIIKSQNTIDSSEKTLNHNKLI